jgi:hypothetical protein
MLHTLQRNTYAIQNLRPTFISVSVIAIFVHGSRVSSLRIDYRKLRRKELLSLHIELFLLLVCVLLHYRHKLHLRTQHR